jgi:hypothetical protein
MTPTAFTSVNCNTRVWIASGGASVHRSSSIGRNIASNAFRSNVLGMSETVAPGPGTRKPVVRGTNAAFDKSTRSDRGCRIPKRSETRRSCRMSPA